MRVASYNIRKAIGLDRQRRPDRILAVLAEIDADVVALQEVDRRLGARASVFASDALASAGWQPVAFARRPESLGWHGNAILVRRHVIVRAHGHVDLPTLEPRGAVWADIIAHGLALRVMGMHLDLSGLRRRQQARAILAATGTGPALLMGDLNEWSRAGGCLADFARTHHFAPTTASFHARRPVARLDRIMATPDLAFAAAGTHRSMLAAVASDHLPIWADIDGTAATR